MVKCCVLLLTSLWIIPNSLSSAKVPSSIAIFASNICESGWKILEKHSYLRSNITMEKKQATLFQKLKNVSDEVEKLEKSTTSTPYDAFKDNITLIIKDSKHENLFPDLFNRMTQIDENFEQLKKYSAEGETTRSETMINFAEKAVSHQPTSTKMLTNTINEYLVPKIKYMYDGGLLKLLADNMNNTRESPDQFLPDLFDKIALIEIKGYAIVQLSYVILETYGEGRYPQERKLTTKTFRNNLKKITRIWTKLFGYDPKQYKEAYLPIAVFAQNIIKSGWKMVDDRSDLKLNRTTKQKQSRTSKKIGNVAELVAQLERSISATSFDVFINVIRSTTNNSRSQSVFTDFYFSMRHIDEHFEDLLRYFENGDSTSMRDLAEVAVSPQSTSIRMLMEKIRRLIVPTTGRESRVGLLKLLADKIELSDEVIRITDESPNQFLYNLFNKIALTQIKAYVIIQFSYVIQEIYNKGHYQKESQIANKKIRKILNELCQETIRTTAKFSRHYWKSDPEKYKNGENYLEITKVLQGYVVNQRLLHNERQCTAKCETFKESNIVTCKNDPFCRKQTRCRESVYSCRSLEEVDMQICLAPAETSRRYDYIKYVNSKTTLGVKSTCSTPTFNVEAWIGWCPYCMCYCDDEGVYSDRFFSLKQAVSDTKKNKVVTGIRFVKKNRIIHLQVQQGELLPYGVINATSLEWVPVDNFKITNRYVYNKQDYLKMTWKDKAVDLHVIEVNDGKTRHKRVLTGVRFTPLKYGMDSNDERRHLNLEIRMTKFHFESGKLFPTRGAHTWFRNLNTEFSPDNPRTKIPTDDLDIPTRAKSQNTIVSKGNQFVEFTHTDMFKDAGQTTIPFIDSQDVVTKVPTPLIGAGLYYKSTEGYGGFIGLKVVTYDFTQHL